MDDDLLVQQLAVLLSKEHSRKQRDLIADWIGSDPEKMSAAIHVLCHHSYRDVQRVAWVINGVAENHPELVVPHLKTLILRLGKTPLPDAVKRNVVRILSFVPLPEEIHSEIVHTCFDYLSSPHEPVAVKAFAMSVLHKLSGTYPEIKTELRELLELELEKVPSPGIKSRAQKILSQLRKQG